MKGLHQQIKNKTDHLRALEWIRACIVIHTLIHQIETGSADPEWEEDCIMEGLSSDSDTDGEGRGNRAATRETPGQRKRRRVKETLFASGITTRQ